jgi:TolC family type I secretion outer membrane protein
MRARRPTTRRPAGSRPPSASAALAGVALAALVAASPASGQTLQEALAQAYSSNPQIEAERAALRATDEQVPQALSNWRPTLEATASAGLSRGESEAGGRVSEFASQPRSLGVAATQPVYRGGRSTAQLSRAENTVQAARARLFLVEQQVLLAAATAYLDVVRDQAVLDLTISNESVLRRQLEATRDRFDVGEVTRTDVSQAESRVAGATAQRIQAEGNLASSRAVYARVVGSAPGRLVQPQPAFALPSTLDEAVEIARGNNPAVVSSRFVEAAARDAVDQTRGEARPTVSLSAGLDRSYDPTTTVDRQDRATLTARVTVPLYQAGAVTSRIREATQIAGQRRIEIDEARTQAVETAIRSWQALTTARASIVSRQAQVRASEIALEGVRQEATVGARTTIDVLDAEQELLDARVSVVQAQRDELVAAFQVLSAIGQLGARQLDLPVQAYDVDVNYRAVRDRW